MIDTKHIFRWLDDDHVKVTKWENDKKHSVNEIRKEQGEWTCYCPARKFSRECQHLKFFRDIRSEKGFNAKRIMARSIVSDIRAKLLDVEKRPGPVRYLEGTDPNRVDRVIIESFLPAEEEKDPIRVIGIYDETLRVEIIYRFEPEE